GDATAAGQPGPPLPECACRSTLPYAMTPTADHQPPVDVTPPAPPTTYRLDYRPGLRMFGIRFVLAAVLVVAAWLCAGAFDEGAGLVAAWVLGLVAALIVVVSILLLVRPPVVVRLDGDGYRLGRVPRGGLRQASWREVTGVTAGNTPYGYALVLRAGERTSTVPLLLVAANANRLRHDINDRLNHAHGYRRLE
ncbi:MAG: hypothetical protein ACRDO7_15785, partial [Nocardioidaceae bacterium]